MSWWLEVEVVLIWAALGSKCLKTTDRGNYVTLIFKRLYTNFVFGAYSLTNPKPHDGLHS